MLAVSLLSPEPPVFTSLVRACLLFCVAAFASAVAGQPPGGTKPTPLIPAKAVPQEKETSELPPLPLIPANAPQLRKVQLELVKEGLDYISRCKELIRTDVWVVADFRKYADVLTETCRTAAELEEKLADRVPWYEVRVRRMKEVENLVDQGVRAGGGAPQELNLIRFQRLQAEIDLLKLKAEVEKAGK